jgi:hypothetical protein
MKKGTLSVQCGLLCFLFCAVDMSLRLFNSPFRELYEFMLNAQKEKGRSKNAKGDTGASEQLKQAQEDYQEEATLFLFRLKSLKQGQFRSLFTQAARHHAAQVYSQSHGNCSVYPFGNKCRN